MARSISIVEYKVRQARFFLERIANSGFDMFAAQCYFDAFASSARSITFSMQSVISEVPGFVNWYEDQQSNLKEDSISRFFNQYRRVSTHIGDTVLRSAGTCKDDSGHRVMKYYFLPIKDLAEVPEQDVLSVCKLYFKKLLGIVFDLFIAFRCQLDDGWYYTKENFDSMGKTIEDAEQELGFPRGWTCVDTAYSESERWAVLRRTQTVGCQLNDLFLRYLEKQVEGPDSKAGKGTEGGGL